jgi:hypothetical protein
VLPAALALAALGCGDDRRKPGTDDGQGRPPAPALGSCLQPAEGCPCAKEGAVTECGVTVSKEEDTLTCREGERTCSKGKWSECLGEKLTQIYNAAPSAPGVQPQGLATTSKDCMDKCEPYCRTLADTPEELMAGPGFKADVTGLSLKPNGINGGNCPDVLVTVANPASAILEITAINTTDGSVTPNTATVTAKCALGMGAINPAWSIDQPDRSYIDANGMLKVFTAIAGDINVTGTSSIDTGTAKLTVKVNVGLIDAGVTNPTAFAGAGSDPDAGTLYPYKGTVFPLDLAPPVVQWKSNGVTADAVEVTLSYPSGSATPTFKYSRIYSGEPHEGPIVKDGLMPPLPAARVAKAPAWAIPEKVWTALGRTTQAQGAMLGRTADIIVQRRTTAGLLYNEMVIPVKFASAALRGTVYYMQYSRTLNKEGGSLNTDTTGNPDLDPATFDPFNAANTTCPVGNNTHSKLAGASTTVGIDMSTPTATRFFPLGENTKGCPVCHSVSAKGNRFVAGSRFLQAWPADLQADTAAGAGYVNDILLDAATGKPKFTSVGEAPNYAGYPTDGGAWTSSRGFGFAALTPDGTYALQGPHWWGNTAGNNNNRTAVESVEKDGTQAKPMFFVPTTNTGTWVKYATTAKLNATRVGDVLTGNGEALVVDNTTPAKDDSILVKNQDDPIDNGIYTVTDLGGSATCTGTLLTISSATASSLEGDDAAYAASKAIDADAASSRWSSKATDPQWIYFDLGSVTAFGCVAIKWEAASAKDYQLQVGASASTDDADWTTIATRANMAGGPRTDSLTGLSSSSRYLRMRGTARNGMYGYSIYDFKVYTGSGSATYKLTRRQDADATKGSASTTDHGMITAKSEVRVTRGVANYSKIFYLNNATDPTINSTPLEYLDTGADPLPVMSMPTISPDGKKIAYVNGDADSISNQGTGWRKGLTVLPFDEVTRKVDAMAKKRIVNNYNSVATDGGIPVKWPFFEHDSRSIVFVQTSNDEYCRRGDATDNDANRACYGDGYGFANTAPTQRGYWPGSLWSSDITAATNTQVKLTKLSSGEQAADNDKAYQPTVLPFASGGYRWVIFTSPRSYGNQLNQLDATGKATNFTCAATMLWVSALEDETSGATDRSNPAFLLPGQDMAAVSNTYHPINERGYLVPSLCKSDGLSCSTSDECCSPNLCRVDSVTAGVPARKCKGPASCSPTGGVCLTSADCCAVGANCVEQTCVVTPPFVEDTFERTFVASCESGFKPLWGAFSYHMTAPNGSHIEFSAKTGETAGDLVTATAVPLKDANASNYGMMAESVDVGKKLATAMISPFFSQLKISMRFRTPTGGSASPILHDWEQRYSCVPAE